MKNSKTERKEIITQRTTMFLHYIIRSLEEHNLTLTAEVLTNINDLLYLINANYYYKIANSHRLDRETIIERILNQIVIYFQNSDSQELTLKAAATIINNCFLLKKT